MATPYISLRPKLRRGEGKAEGGRAGVDMAASKARQNSYRLFARAVNLAPPGREKSFRPSQVASSHEQVDAGCSH